MKRRSLLRRILLPSAGLHSDLDHVFAQKSGIVSNLENPPRGIQEGVGVYHTVPLGKSMHHILEVGVDGVPKPRPALRR